MPASISAKAEALNRSYKSRGYEWDTDLAVLSEKSVALATETEARSWLEEHAVELYNNNCAEMRAAKVALVS